VDPKFATPPQPRVLAVIPIVTVVEIQYHTVIHEHAHNVHKILNVNLKRNATPTAIMDNAHNIHPVQILIVPRQIRFAKKQLLMDLVNVFHVLLALTALYPLRSAALLVLLETLYANNAPPTPIVNHIVIVTPRANTIQPALLCVLLVDLIVVLNSA